MSEIATLEAPDSEETKAETPDETKGVDSATDVQDDAVQTGAQETPEEHLAALEAERQKAEQAEIDLRAEQKAQELRAREEREGQEKARKERVKSAFPSALRRLNSVMDSYEGFTPENRKEFTDVLEALNLVHEEASNERVSEQYREAFAQNLGDQADAFWKEAEALQDDDGGIPVAKLLDLYAEKRAPQLKGVKSMTLEQAKSASPVLARELASALKAEFEKGRENPLPAGEPGGGEGGSSTYSSEHALNVAFNNGELSHAQYAEQYKRLTGHEP